MVRAQVRAPLLASIKRNPDAPRLPPNDMAGPTRVVRLDDQFEPVRDEQRGYDLESSADVRNVANGAVDCAAAETDGASF